MLKASKGVLTDAAGLAALALVVVISGVLVGS
jgi:hypothetical protein